MKKKYETTFIIKVDLLGKTDEISKKYDDLIINHGGFVTSTIVTKNEFIKIEICFEFDEFENSNSYQCIAELEKEYHLDDDVLRFIVIRTE